MNNAWCDRSVQLFYCERLEFWNNSEHTFQLYRYKMESIIVAHSSVITLIGYVNSNVGLGRFSSGTAIYITNAHGMMPNSNIRFTSHQLQLCTLST